MKTRNLPILDLLAIAGIFILIYTGYSTPANLLIGAYLLFTVYRNFPTLQATKGSRAYNAGNTDMAMTYFKKAVKHPFAKPYIKSSFGYVLLREGNLDEAEKYLLEAESSKMKDPRFRYNNILNMAILEWKKGNLPKAIEIVEGIKDDYKNSILYEILGYLYIADGDYEKALAFNKEAYEFNKDDNVITDNLAQCYFFLGELEKAEALYKDTIDYIKFPEAHYYYGQILHQKGDYLGAHDAFKRALRLKMSFLSIITKEDIEEKFEALKKEMEEKNLTVEVLEEEKMRREEEAKALEEKALETEDEKETSEYKVD